ncbi:tetratricopeptide repeat-containing sensor histidine kinase [Reichenbachiella sp. MALMAid0571]|uniref:ATP-binding protein n=1 Tax=Reichenbachiella sp. MALMAid0571 TaxID=3143939 RepID=UPI0032DEF82A
MLGYTMQAQSTTKDSLAWLLIQATSPEQKINLLLDIGKEYAESNPDSALLFANRSLFLIDSLQFDSLPKGKAYVLISSAYSYKGEYDESVEYALKALKNGQAFKDQIVVYDAYANLGIDFMYREDYVKSKGYFEKAKTIATQINEPERIAHSVNNLGLVAYYLGNKDEELRLYEEALTLFKEIDDKEGIGNALLNIGTVYTVMGRYTKAEKLYLQALTIFSEIGYKTAYGNVIQSLSENYLEQGNYAEALKRSEEALRIFLANDNKMDIVYCYELLTKIYARKKDFEHAYIYMEKYHQLSEQIFNEEKSNQIVDLELKYDTETKEQEIELLNQKNQLASTELEAANKEKMYYLIIAILIFIVAGSLFIVYQQRNKANQLLAQKNTQLSQLNATKDRLFGVVAHDLKNPLSAFNSITQSLIDNQASISEEDLKYFLEKLFKSSKELNGLLQNLLEWSMSQSGDLSFQPKTLQVKHLIDAAIEPLKLNLDIKQIHFSKEVDQNLYITADQKMTLTILRNLLSNAIKFTPLGGNITVKAYEKDEDVVIKVSDSGIGIDNHDLEKIFHHGTNYNQIGSSSEKGTGLGLVLCKELIDRQSGDISVESQLGEGSTFTIKFAKALHIETSVLV